MARKSEDGRWKSKFARFVYAYGVQKLANRLGIHWSAVYHWLRGSTSPHRATAFKIQTLAKQRGIDLSLDEIYQHFHDARSKRHTAPSVKSQSARV